jgi:hypothetical protein
MRRLRTILGFKAVDSLKTPKPDLTPSFLMFVSKLKACVNHPEQFSVKIYNFAGIQSRAPTAYLAIFLDYVVLWESFCMPGKFCQARLRFSKTQVWN